MSTRYRMKIWYAATREEDAPQVHEHLTEEQMEMGSGAFLRDMLVLHGKGVRRVMVEVEES